MLEGLLEENFSEKHSRFQGVCVFLQNLVEWQIMAPCQLCTSASSYRTTDCNALWLQ